MAFGDDSRARNRIDYEKGLAQAHLDNLRRDTIVPQNQQLWNRFLLSYDRDMSDYDRLMNQYYDFATTGGYSPMDIANLRARALAPTRAIYANFNRDIDRQRALQGGYAPGYMAAKSRLARDLSQSMSDASTNVEAAIAQMIAEGKRFGASGGSQLYGTAPGLTRTMGDLMSESTNQQLRLAELQNQLGLGTMQAQIEAGKLPGKTQTALGNIRTGLDLAKDVAKFPFPWM